MTLPLISVVVTTKNEEKNIKNCLQSIQRQTYPAEFLETIVVDNQSSDCTKELALGFTDKVFDVGPERSAQRNFGIEQANGKYVLYLDADMDLSERVIEDCYEVVKHDPEMVGLYISEVVTGGSFFCKVRSFERRFYEGTVIDCARFLNKKVFMELGGFDLSMSGPEDWDFDKRLRDVGKVGLVYTPIFHNEAEFKLGKYLAKKSYYAKDFDTYISKWGWDDADIQKQFGFWYRFLWVFLENGKWKKLVTHPFLVFGMYFLRVMVGIQFLRRKSLRINNDILSPYA